MLWYLTAPGRVDGCLVYDISRPFSKITISASIHFFFSLSLSLSLSPKVFVPKECTKTPYLPLPPSQTPVLALSQTSVSRPALQGVSLSFVNAMLHSLEDALTTAVAKF